LTAFQAPGATGSGNAELIAYLNGVNYPKLIGFNTLVVKILGVTFAVVGGLCVGKEGPLAHIGANVGAAIGYFPFPRFDYLRNDRNKRELIAAGCSAGVSAAFGAPIGGALFAYELSKPNDFWKFSVLWKSFFACSIAVFFSAIFQ
jgi:H+/Cl- antiporter ClcA